MIEDIRPAEDYGKDGVILYGLHGTGHSEETENDVVAPARTDYMDADKLNGYMRRVWKIATDHGFHDKPIPRWHYLGLIMTEVAEAVEADRNDRRADTHRMETCVNNMDASETMSKILFHTYYDNHVRGSLEEEFADIVIRILDMAQDIHGEKMKWFYDQQLYPYSKRISFIENSWCFVRRVLGWGMSNINHCLAFMFDWSEDLGIDLWQHIEWKMKYNELRPYKHGSKKY